MANRNETVIYLNVDPGPALKGINTALDAVNKGANGAVDGLNDAIRKVQVPKELAKSSIVISVDADEAGAKNLVGRMQELNTLGDDIVRDLQKRRALEDDSVTSLRGQVTQAKQARDQLQRVRQVVDEYGRNVKITNDQWVIANNRVQQLTRELQIASASSFWDRLKAEFNLGGLIEGGKILNDLVNTFQSVSIVIGQVVAAINQVTGALAQLQQLQLTFNSIGLSTTEFNNILETGIGIATRYGTNIESVLNGFEKLTPSLKAAGLGTKQVTDIVDSLSTRFVAFGLSADEANRVMNAVVQAFGKGKLMAEELTQQISEADPAFRVNFAQALGVTVEKLNEMVEAGLITNDVIADTIPKMKVASEYFGKLGTTATDAANAFANGQATFDQVRNQLTNISKISLFNLTESLQGFIAGVTRVQASVTDLFAAFSKTSILSVFGDVLGGLLSVISSVVNIITGLIKGIDSLIGPIIKGVQAIDGWAASFLKFEPIITTITTLIGVSLVRSVLTFLASLAGTGSITKFFDILVSSATALKGVFTGAFQIITQGFTVFTNALSLAAAATKKQWGEIIGGFVKGAGDAKGSLESIRNSFDNLTDGAAPASKGIKQLGASLVDVQQSGKLTTASMVAAAEAVGGLTISLVKFAAKTVVLLAVVAAISALVEAFTGLGIATQVAQDVAKGFDEIEESAKKVPGATTEAGNSIAGFNKKMDELSSANENAGLSLAKVLGLAKDYAIFREVGAVVEEASKANIRLQSSLQNAEVALANYNKEAGKTDSVLRETTTQAIQKAVTEAEKMIAIFTAAKERLIREIETQGGEGISDEQRARLQQLEAFIQQWVDTVADLKQRAAKEDIQIKVTADTVAFNASTDKLKQDIEALEKLQATIAFGTVRYEEVKNQIEGLKILAETLTAKTYDIQIKIIEEGDLALIKTTIDYYQEVVNNVKARIDLEKASFDVVKASAEYQIAQADRLREAEENARQEIIDGLKEQLSLIQERNDKIERGLDKQLDKLRDEKDLRLETLREELEGLRERGASQNRIEAKERQIKEYTKQQNTAIREQEKVIAAEKERALAEEEAKKKQIREQERLAREEERADRLRRAAEEERIFQIDKALAANMLALTQEKIAADRIALEIKLEQQRLENEVLKLKQLEQIENAKLAVTAAQVLVTEKERGVAIAQNALARDPENRQLQEMLANAQASLALEQTKLNYAKENVIRQNALIDVYNRQQQLFDASQQLIRQNFELNAQVTTKTAEAQAAKYGVLTASAEQSLTTIQRVLVGYVTVGEKSVQIWRDVEVPIQKAATGASAFGTNINAATTQLAGASTATSELSRKVGEVRDGFGNIQKTELGMNVRAATGDMRAFIIDVDKASGKLQIIPTIDIASRIRESNGELIKTGQLSGISKTALQEIGSLRIDQPVKNANSELDRLKGNAGQAKAEIDKIGNANVKKPIDDAATSTDKLKTKGGEIKTQWDQLGTSPLDAPLIKAQAQAAAYKPLVDVIRTGYEWLIGADLKRPLTIADAEAQKYIQSVYNGTAALERQAGKDISGPHKQATVAAKDTKTAVDGVSGSMDKIAGKDLSKPFNNAKTPSGDVKANVENTGAGIDAANKKNLGGAITPAVDPAKQVSNEIQSVYRNLVLTRNTNLAKPFVDAVAASVTLIGKINDLKVLYQELGRIKIDEAIRNATGAVVGFIAVFRELNSVGGGLVKVLDGIDKMAGNLRNSISKIDIENALLDPIKKIKDALNEIGRKDPFSKFSSAADSSQKIADKLTIAATNWKLIKENDLAGQFSKVAGYGDQIKDSTGIALNNVNNIVSAIKSLNGFQATVTVKVIKALASGGPVEAGKTYQVNELGREAFLSNTGRLSMIHKPPYGMWKAPNDGTVIPAHMVSQFKIPSTGVSSSHPKIGKISQAIRNDSTPTKIGRAVYNALAESGILSKTDYAANSQASQALQIGKLTHAINKLVDKDWGVNVNVRDKRSNGFPRNLGSML